MLSRSTYDRSFVTGIPKVARLHVQGMVTLVRCCSWKHRLTLCARSSPSMPLVSFVGELAQMGAFRVTRHRHSASLSKASLGLGAVLEFLKQPDNSAVGKAIKNRSGLVYLSLN